MSEPEAQLVRRAKKDPQAFGLLYERYVDRIYSYILFRTSNEQDAEDLTARTFHQALASIRNYNERGFPFSAWLYRIAHNLVANWHRDHHRRPQVSLDEVWPLLSKGRPSPDGVAEKNSEEDSLRAVIQGLPPDRQLLLVLKFGEGKSNSEIGKVLGRSEGAVKSLFHRTLDELRAEMKKRGYE
ncbi:MAG: sigma-70 family RNA polymerase sigma factor [Chloroflexi bacterium]|nr:sigma-70 family RNA polymerase sigma factor [Chloroflexota bacterium]MBI3733508.1 sigma-70 family RNA polymerase sigma factor [Chloroflexota bacterium]